MRPLIGKDGNRDKGYDDWRRSGKVCFSTARRIDDWSADISQKAVAAGFRQIHDRTAPAVVVMEACGSAHYWAREMSRLGHEVKLIASHNVKPFVKRQKNNAADAEAIVIAAQRPEMRFVEPKYTEQQSRAILFRARERLVQQRTELVNALRACLYKFGHVVPQGIHQLNRIKDILDEPNSDLPELMREECRDSDYRSNVTPDLAWP